MNAKGPNNYRLVGIHYKHEKRITIIWNELRLNPGPLVPQATAPTARSLLLRLEELYLF